VITPAAAIIATILLAPVEYRGGEISDDQVLRVDERGVLVRTQPIAPESAALAPATRTISWHRVKRVLGPRAPEAEPFSTIAEDAWRAAERLRRGDAPLAEPLFERLAEIYAGFEGPTAGVVAEGLLLCRIDRGAWGQAIGPWLDFAEHLRASDALANPPFATRPIDERTLLAPQLPPMWRPGDLTTSIERAATRRLGASDPIVAALAAWTSAAARFERTGNASLPALDPEIAQRPGVALLSVIVTARAGDPTQRADARADLTRLITRHEGEWIEAWARAALGRSLLRESADDTRLDAVLELLHVPARFAETQPYLAGLALAEAAAELHAQGQTAQADRLRARLLRNFPGHSAIPWLEQTLSANPPAPQGDDPA
jgi:hypothetical protein